MSPRYIAALKLGGENFAAQVVLPNSSRIASNKRIHVVSTTKKYKTLLYYLLERVVANCWKWMMAPKFVNKKICTKPSRHIYTHFPLGLICPNQIQISRCKLVNDEFSARYNKQLLVCFALTQSSNNTNDSLHYSFYAYKRRRI